MFAIACSFSLDCENSRAGELPVPQIDGDWWQVAGNPDLGEFTSPKQEPVDFAVWQAADGTWQLWSCIRKTNCGGNTRLFHGWEGRKLTDRNWKPLGIMMQGEPEYGESVGGMQAPHVIRHDGTYTMFYGDWANICMATSIYGKGPYCTECPHVVFHPASKQYYLFNTQRYGRRNHTTVFRSSDPLQFGINDNRLEVATVPVAAPEIILHEGQYYIASLLPSLEGIQIARLKWSTVADDQEN